MHASSLRRGAAALGCMAVGGLLLGFPTAAAQGAARGISLCLNTAVPSLFPFMVLAAYISASGVGEQLGKPLCRPVQWLGLPAACAPAVLLALLGGYPVGAAGVSRLLHTGQISPAQARRAMVLCCLPSPAFMVSAIGNSLLASPRAGAALWACTLLGAVLPLLLRPAKPQPAAKTSEAPPQSGSFFSAVEAAARSVLSLSALIVVFCTLQELLAATPLPEWLAAELGTFLPAGAAKSLLPALLEVTTGMAVCKENGAPLWLFAFAAGWGGLCVQGQVFSFFKPGELPKAAFLRARLVHGLLSAGLAAGFFRFFPEWQPAISVFATHTVTQTEIFSSTAPAGIALLALCGVFCLTAGNRHKTVCRGSA